MRLVAFRPTDPSGDTVSSHRPTRLLAAALALVLPLSACGGATTSHSSRCSGGTCTVNLTGVQTFEVDGPDGVERDLGVGPIEPDAVTLSVYDEQARLTAGQAARIAEVPVEVVSVSGRDVTLRIGGTEVESADDDTSAAGTHRTTKAASTKTTSTKTTSTKTTKAATKPTATKSR
jgi:hypothetical protein